MSYQQTRSTQDPPFYPNGRTLTLTGTNVLTPPGIEVFTAAGKPPTFETRFASITVTAGLFTDYLIAPMSPDETVVAMVYFTAKMVGGGTNTQHFSQIKCAFWDCIAGVVTGTAIPTGGAAIDASHQNTSPPGAVNLTIDTSGGNYRIRVNPGGATGSGFGSLRVEITRSSA